MFLQLALCATILYFSIILRRRATTNSSVSTHSKSLSQIPGPMALPIIGHLRHLLSPLKHRTFHNLAAKHGRLLHLRVGSFSAVVITTSELAKEFLKNHDLDFVVHDKSLVSQRFFHDAAFTFSPNGQYWKLVKKHCVTEFLGNRVVNQLQPIRVYETKCFLRVLFTKAKLGEQVNFTKEFTKLTTNILSQMMMGFRCSGTEKGAKQSLIVHEVAEILGTPNLADVFPFFKFFDFQGIKKKCEDIYRRYDGMLEEILVKREEVRRKKIERIERVTDGENGAKDFLDILYDVVEDENAEITLTRDHIKALILFFSTEFQFQLELTERCNRKTVRYNFQN